MEANGYAVLQGPAMELSGGGCKALSSTSAKSLPSHQVQHRWPAKSHLAGAVFAYICPRVKDIGKTFYFLEVGCIFFPKV